MERDEFEALRDLPGKRITVDVRFSAPRNASPLYVAEGIAIENDANVELRLNVNFNPLAGSKTFNVVLLGVGPICRLDVDGPAHAPAGRSHKHALQTTRCSDRNLPDGVVDRPELAGLPLEEAFAIFCKQAHITFTGRIAWPVGALP